MPRIADRAAVADAHGTQGVNLGGRILSKRVAHALHDTPCQRFQCPAVLPDLAQPFLPRHLQGVAVGHTVTGDLVVLVQCADLLRRDKPALAQITGIQMECRLKARFVKQLYQTAVINLTVIIAECHCLGQTARIQVFHNGSFFAVIIALYRVNLRPARSGPRAGYAPAGRW